MATTTEPKHRSKITSDPLTEDGSESVEEGEIRPTKGVDAALEFAQQGISIEITDEVDKRVRRKIDRNILPWMCCLYMLQYLDKTTLSYASSMGINKDLGMSTGQYAWYVLFLQSRMFIVWT